MKYFSAVKYSLTKGVSLPQAFLKHSILPIHSFLRVIPSCAKIVDLGCGEGILSNILARLLPESSILGIDLDETRITIAQKNAPPNAVFCVGDVFQGNLPFEIDVAILNDMVHHNQYERHLKLFDLISKHMKGDGLIILKEVDQKDRLDKLLTTFFDSRIYPGDPLCFRSIDEWISLLSRVGIKDIRFEKVKHPWIASRSIIFARFPEGRSKGYLYDKKQIFRNTLSLKNNSKIKIVFVTGANGFIGRHLLTELLQNGLNGYDVRVIILIRNFEKMPKELKKESRIVPLLGDLQDLPWLSDALKGVDYVFHLAAEVKFFKGQDVWRNNYYGTLSLLNALDGIQLERFVYASTIGALDRMPDDPCDKPLEENAEPNPSSEYGKSKLKAEEAVINSGYNYTIVRIPWAYGEGMTPDTHVRNLMQTVHDKKIFTFFNFPGKVSIISAKDVARAFIFLATNDRAKNDLFFITDGEPISLGRLFQLMGEVVSKKTALLSIPGFIQRSLKKLRPYLPLTIQNLNSDVLTASNKKISSLGFKTQVDKKEGLEILARSMGFIS